MVKPERRTRADVVAAIAIAVVIAVTAASRLVDQRRAGRRSAGPRRLRFRRLATAKAVPRRCGSCGPRTARRPRHRWWWPPAWSPVTATTSRAATRSPAARCGATAERNLELCGVSWVYQYAVAVYPDSRGCGQVSTIDAKTGKRGPARTAYADPEVTAVIGRHRGAVGRGQPARAVAVRHGPDAQLRLPRRQDQARHSRVAAVPADLGRRQLDRRLGARGLPECRTTCG